MREVKLCAVFAKEERRFLREERGEEEEKKERKNFAMEERRVEEKGERGKKINKRFFFSFFKASQINK